MLFFIIMQLQIQIPHTRSPQFAYTFWYLICIICNIVYFEIYHNHNFQIKTAAEYTFKHNKAPFETNPLFVEKDKETDVS